ncbi:MAG: NAD(P)H-dependent oxidoreductase [Saprospiraceae bacterium]|nr:NAD(P)H-dependent oxidoreductase [Saprospiraceae bacterium]
MKKILIVNGHPDKESFNAALTEAYAKGARAQANTKVDVLYLADLTFDPILQYGYRKRTELEPDLLRAIALLKEADHTVWVYPVWWGGMPALLKGFFDRTFLSGITYKYRENSLFWDKLMKGKTARVISTMDAPVWYYRLAYSSAGHKAIKRVILGFCGFKVKFFTMGSLKFSSEQQREKWLQKAERLGIREARASRKARNRKAARAKLSLG